MNKVYIYAPMSAFIAPAVFIDTSEIVFKLICCSSVMTAFATIAFIQADALFSARQKDSGNTNDPDSKGN